MQIEPIEVVTEQDDADDNHSNTPEGGAVTPPLWYLRFTGCASRRSLAGEVIIEPLTDFFETLPNIGSDLFQAFFEIFKVHKILNI